MLQLPAGLQNWQAHEAHAALSHVAYAVGVGDPDQDMKQLDRIQQYTLHVYKGFDVGGGLGTAARPVPRRDFPAVPDPDYLPEHYFKKVTGVLLLRKLTAPAKPLASNSRLPAW